MSNVLEPGTKAPCSGVFKAIHVRHHAPPHYVTAVFGEIFPRCQECFNEVRFELAVSAVHVKAHPFFSTNHTSDNR